MEVCFEVRLEEDRTSAMSILPTLAIDYVAFNVKTPVHDSEEYWKTDPCLWTLQETMAY